MNNIISTTLNPLFSENQIAAQRDLFLEVSNEEIKETKDQLDKLTEATIKNMGKSKNIDIESDKEFKIAILDHATNLVRIRNIKFNYEKMIESNIAILNGKTINEVEQQFYDNKKDEMPMSDDEDVEKMYKSWLENRKRIINKKS